MESNHHLRLMRPALCHLSYLQWGGRPGFRRHLRGHGPVLFSLSYDHSGNGLIRTTGLLLIRQVRSPLRHIPFVPCARLELAPSGFASRCSSFELPGHVGGPASAGSFPVQPVTAVTMWAAPGSGPRPRARRAGVGTPASMRSLCSCQRASCGPAVPSRLAPGGAPNPSAALKKPPVGRLELGRRDDLPQIGTPCEHRVASYIPTVAVSAGIRSLKRRGAHDLFRRLPWAIPAGCGG